MSETVAKTLPIGPVEVYWADNRLGSPMSQATVRYTKETVQAGLEDVGLNVLSRKTKETCEVDVTINDFKTHQLRYTYDQAEQYDQSGTLRASAFSSSTNTIFFFKEEHVLNGTTNITVDESKMVTGQTTVYKSDLSNTPGGYVESTDWTGTFATGNIKRIGAGAITDGENVIVEYKATATSASVFAGGLLSDFEGELKLVHYPEDGKPLQFTAYRAKRIGDSEVAISMAAEFGGVPMTFHCLADQTKQIGGQLFEWATRA